MVDRNTLFDRGAEYFVQRGSAVMKLTPEAAVEVCRDAALNGLLVIRVEGGIWHNPGFEARLDCIWDGGDPPVPKSAAEANNSRACDFIREESREHTAFVVTTVPFG